MKSRNNTPNSEKNESYDLSDLEGIFKLIINENEENAKKHIVNHIKKIINDLKDIEVLFLCRSLGHINEFDSDNLYNRLPSDNSKNILLIINSQGGSIEPAYLISKCCKEYAKDKFIVSIPRRAKSAATLIALGADEIHMGPLSEMGPIDPQVNGLPALSLSNALEWLASLSKKYPESSSMFADYLSKTLPLNILGYFERISESAEHYALRLLQEKENLNNNSKDIAHKLVYEYKDHSFVIGKYEATGLFGEEVVKVGTPEYDVGNKVYTFLENVNLVCQIQKNKKFNLIGSVEDLYLTNMP